MPICLNCDKEFEAKRSDAQLCSANCRQQFKRNGNKLRGQIEPNADPMPAIAEGTALAKPEPMQEPVKAEYVPSIFEETISILEDVELAKRKIEQLKTHAIHPKPAKRIDIDKIDTPFPKDWDTLGRIDKLKWLTANR